MIHSLKYLPALTLIKYTILNENTKLHFSKPSYTSRIYNNIIEYFHFLYRYTRVY